MEWDPAKDQASGNACKAYGAGAIMRVPERLHITWVNDDTLRVETDAGEQTRIFHFDDTKPAERTANLAGIFRGRLGRLAAARICSAGSGGRSRSTRCRCRKKKGT